MSEIQWYRVPVTFFVEASSPEGAEAAALAELGSSPVQKLIGEALSGPEIYEPARLRKNDTQDWT